MSARQLPLEFGFRPAFGRDDFFVAASNREAVELIERWRDWPGPGLAVWGPEGCGKSHLAAQWCDLAGAKMIGAAALRVADADDLAARPLAVEDGDQGVDETALLHLVNCLGQRGHKFLVTGRAPPARWGIALNDLRSRLAALPAVAVAQPDDALLGAVLLKLFADRQLRVGEEVMAYLLHRMERSLASAGAVVAELDAAALDAKRNINVALARDVLQRRSEPKWI
jgi:chromosomal replication initiation ATPase DnaA